MAAFDQASVFGLGARRPTGARSVALGWPVWATHVRATVVGASARDGLDLFEAGVMDVAAAGVRGRRTIAADLDLDPELVAHVIAALGRRGWMDESGAPTAVGMELLDRRRGEREHYVSGFVLVDAWTGRVLDGLHEDLEPLEVTDDGERERERDGRRGHNASGWGSLQAVLGRSPTRVTLVPARRSAPDVRAAEERAMVLEALSRGTRAVAARDAIRGVAPLGEPWPARVLMWAYRRVAGTSGEEWALDRDIRVLDASGDQDGIEFEAALSELVARPEGAKALASLHRLDDRDGANGDSTREKQRRLLLERLGPVPPDHPAVDALLKARVLRGTGMASTSLVELCISLETTLKEAATEQEYRRAQARLRDRRHAAVVLAEALENCGFRPDVPAPILSAISDRDGRLMLRRLVALIVLIAADDDGHPLRTLAAQEAEDAAALDGRPEAIAWLGELDELAHHRNESSHGRSPGERRRVPDQYELDRWFHLVERTTSHLLRIT